MPTPRIQHRKRLFWVLACIFTSHGLLLAQDTGPTITIVQPQLNNTYTGTIPADIQISLPFASTTLSVALNGTNITQSFNLLDCSSVISCDARAQLPQEDVVQGTNILVVDVSGTNLAVSTARVKFEFNSPSAATAPVEKMIAGVGVQADSIAQGADPNDVNNYQIILGPGPGFPIQTYTAANLNCSAGINSVQVLVLGRQTLAPETRVGGSATPGQACFGDATSLANFFKTIPAGDLVIANSFGGLMPNLDTTAIGGTNYTNAKVAPWGYNIIGVAGAPAGVAYESWAWVINGQLQSARPLQGSLMLDIRQNYFFVPSDYREFKTIPNDPVSCHGLPCATIQYAGEPFSDTPFNWDGAGGFYLFAIDRHKGFVQYTSFYPTNSQVPGVREAAMYGLLEWLQGANPEYILFLTTAGVPFYSSTQLTPTFLNAISALGGNPYMMQKLAANTPAGPPAYTLITSTDPAYVAAGYVVENSSIWSAQQETGAVDGILARDRTNQWYVKQALSDAPGPDGVTSPPGWAWEQVGYQQPQDWPTWTPAQQAAYADLTSSSNNYPVITSRLGCSTSCQPIRAYYDGGVGGTGASDLNVLKINWESVVYKTNPDYTAEDLQAVVNQLAVEQGYLSNVYTLYSLFRALTYESNDSLSSQLSQVANQLDSSVNAPQYNPIVPIGAMEKAAAVTSLLSLLPGAGPAFGAVSTLLGAVTAFVPSETSNVPDGGYAVTFNELASKNQTFATDLANADDVMFTGFTNDWGKLQAIGSGYGAHQAPWYMCQTCVGAQPPRTALPAIALGAKRQFYSQLLGLTYSLDTFRSIPYAFPTSFGSTWYKPSPVRGQPSTKMCDFFYANANPQAWLVYPSPPPSNNNDMYILTQTSMTPGNPLFPPGADFPTLSFPSQDLVNDLIGSPTLVNGFLAGGAGLIPDQLFYSQYWTPTPPRVLTLRSGQNGGGAPFCTN